MPSPVACDPAAMTKPCPRCGKPIAAASATDFGARACPHCGYETWAGRLLAFPVLTVFAFFVLWRACA